jgi:hypothetical protein
MYHIAGEEDADAEGQASAAQLSHKQIKQHEVQRVYADPNRSLQPVQVLLQFLFPGDSADAVHPGAQSWFHVHLRVASGFRAVDLYPQGSV